MSQVDFLGHLVSYGVLMCWCLCFIFIGKTTALRIALSIYGVLVENSNSPHTSASSLVAQSVMTTLPLGERCHNK